MSVSVELKQEPAQPEGGSGSDEHHLSWPGAVCLAVALVIALGCVAVVVGPSGFFSAPARICTPLQCRPCSGEANSTHIAVHDYGKGVRGAESSSAPTASPTMAPTTDAHATEAPSTDEPPSTSPSNAPTGLNQPTGGPTTEADPNDPMGNAPVAPARIELPAPRHLAGSNHMDGYDAVTDLRTLQWLASQGLVVMGDSPATILYVRLIAHIEGIRSEVLREGMLNANFLEIRGYPTYMQMLVDRGVTQGSKDPYPGSPIVDYLGTGPNLGRYRIHNRPAYTLQQVVSKVAVLANDPKLQISGIRFVYVGLPFLHVLYEPGWGGALPVCEPEYDLRADIIATLDALQREAVKHRFMVLLATANSHTAEEETRMRTSLKTKPSTFSCQVSCWNKTRCEELSQSVTGMVHANRIAIEALQNPKYDRLRLLRYDLITLFRNPSLYKGGGHYHNAVTDQKVALLLAESSLAWRDYLRQKLLTLSQSGIAFVGDSPTRRLYIRSIVHLEGITDEPLAAAMQNSAKASSKAMRVKLAALNTTASTHSPQRILKYRGTGINQRSSLTYEMEEHGTLPAGWAKKLRDSGTRIFYFGVPLLHMLYHPLWNTVICNEAFDLRASILSLMSQLNKAASLAGMVGFVGTANTYSDKEDHANSEKIKHPEKLRGPGNRQCVSCWNGTAAHRAQCLNYSQTQQGMTNANQVVIDAIDGFEHLRLVRMDLITAKQPADMYLGSH